MTELSIQFQRDGSLVSEAMVCASGSCRARGLFSIPFVGLSSDVIPINNHFNINGKITVAPIIDLKHVTI